MMNRIRYLYRRMYWKAEPLNSDYYPLKDVYWNVNRGNERKRALLLFVAEPFSPSCKKDALHRHSNYRHSCAIVDILSDFGFSVDVTDWMNPDPPSSHNYQLLIGLGIAFERACLDAAPDTKKVFLAYGADNEQAIKAERKRLRSFGLRTGIVGKLRYRRRSDDGPLYADYILVHGNEWVLNTFRPKTTCPAFLISNSDLRRAPKIDDVKLEQRNAKEFLWFASFAAIHRGLDVLVEIFKDRSDLTLHVIGSVQSEQEFWLAYSETLARCPNIKFYGFVNVSSEQFREILSRSVAHLFLSASDGNPGAVVTTMQAGLIPIVTKESGIDSPVDGILVKDVRKRTICKAIAEIETLSASELAEKAHRISEYACKEFSEKRFEETVRSALSQILA